MMPPPARTPPQAFIRSGGYSLSKQVARVTSPTLVMWGRQDKIL